MEERLYGDYDFKELKSKLKLLIEIKCEDCLHTHFQQVFLFKNGGKVCGSINKDSFKIWIQEQGRAGATGVFYPIIEGSSQPLEGGVGRAFFLLVTIGLSCGLLTGIGIQEDIAGWILRSLVNLVIIGLFLTVPLFTYFRTSRIIKKYLIKELDLTYIK